MAGAQRMHYQGMKAVDPQRMSRNAGDTGQGTRVKPVFGQRQQGDRANKHRRSAVEIPVSPKSPRQRSSCSVPREMTHTAAMNSAAQSGVSHFLSVSEGANGSAQHAVEHVVEGVAVDIEVDWQPLNPDGFNADHIGVGQNAEDRHQRQQHCATGGLNLNQRREQVDDGDSKEKPQVVEDRLLQQIL